jgi:hypothetical protein
MEDNVKVSGKVKLIVKDAKTGKILQIVEGKNLITTAGKTLIASLLNGESVNLIGYCAVGSGTTTPNASDTTLEGEIGRLPITSKSRSINVITYSTFFGSGDLNGTWNKVGLFNAQTGGVMFSEYLLPSTISKDATKTVDIEYAITIG